MYDAQPLILALAGEQSERVAAAAELRRFPGLYLTALKQGLRSGNPEIRHGCYWVISTIQAPGILTLLSQGLNDPEPRVSELAGILLWRKLGPVSGWTSGWLGPEAALPKSLLQAWLEAEPRAASADMLNPC